MRKTYDFIRKEETNVLYLTVQFASLQQKDNYHAKIISHIDRKKVLLGCGEGSENIKRKNPLIKKLIEII